MDDPCYYCGIAANSIDHVPPQSARSGIISTGLILNYPFVTVHACRECNSALGARGLWKLEERKKYVKTFLKRKYRKYLAIPDWSDSELAKMEPNFRNYILVSLKTRETIRNRIKW